MGFPTSLKNPVGGGVVTFLVVSPLGLYQISWIKFKDTQQGNQNIRSGREREQVAN